MRRRRGEAPKRKEVRVHCPLCAREYDYHIERIPHHITTSHPEARTAWRDPIQNAWVNWRTEDYIGKSWAEVTGIIE